ICVRNLDFRKTGEKINQLVVILVRKTKSGHAELEPRTDGDRGLEEAKHPWGLDLFSFAIKYRRREGRALLIVFSDESTLAFDFVAADTVVLVHESATVDDFNCPTAVVRQIARGYFPIAEPSENNTQGFDIRVSQVELWHHLLDALSRISSWSLKLIVSPIIPCFRDIGVVAEEKLFE